jgi:hypothetical protein
MIIQTVLSLAQFLQRHRSSYWIDGVVYIHVKDEKKVPSEHTPKNRTSSDFRSTAEANFSMRRQVTSSSKTAASNSSRLVRADVDGFRSRGSAPSWPATGRAPDRARRASTRAGSNFPRRGSLCRCAQRTPRTACPG